MRELERRVVLQVLDRKWREHLYEMDYLQEGIQLRAYAQRDPLVEYQREGFDLFGAMMDAIKEESVAYLFNLEVQVEQEAPAAADGAPVTDEASAAQAAAAAPSAEAAARHAPTARARLLSPPGRLEVHRLEQRQPEPGQPRRRWPAPARRPGRPASSPRG